MTSLFQSSRKYLQKSNYGHILFPTSSSSLQSFSTHLDFRRSHSSPYLSSPHPTRIFCVSRTEILHRVSLSLVSCPLAAHSACQHFSDASISNFVFLTTASVAARPRKTTFQPRNSTIPCKILYSLDNPMLPFRMFATPFSSLANRSPLFFSFFPVPKPFIIRTSAKRASNSHRICTSKTQDLKPFIIRTYEETGEGDLQPFDTAAHHSPRPQEMPSSYARQRDFGAGNEFAAKRLFARMKSGAAESSTR